MKTGRDVVVFLSGRGSNLHALLSSRIGKRVSLVVSDNPRAPGLAVAGDFGVPASSIEYTTCAEFERLALAQVLLHEPCLVALAGFMRILSGDFIRRLNGWIVNIHPSLLPALPGLDTHRRALEGAMKRHGCTVHWVAEEVDAGPVIDQRSIPVTPDDTPESLAERILAVEHVLYPETVARILEEGLSPGMPAAAC